MDIDSETVKALVAVGEDSDGNLFYDINEYIEGLGNNATPGKKPGQSRLGGNKASKKTLNLDGLNIKIISNNTGLTKQQIIDLLPRRLNI